MEIKVIFNYLNKNYPATCKENDEMKKMYEQFISKLDDDSKITHYIYYYDGNKLGNEGTIKNNKYLSGKNELIISVQKKLRIIKCPKCMNDCIIDLNNYLASFYGCKNGHSNNEVYDQYIYLQRTADSQIRCSEPNCSNTQQNYTKGFYKCLHCSKILESSTYYCKEHCEKHKLEYKDHACVNYDKKNYYCVNHFNKFIKYCFTHKENLCEECEKEHENCNIAKYQSMTPNIDELKKSLDTMEKDINTLKIVIKNLKYRLDGALRVFNRYHYIAKDIIGKFELFNQDLKNHRILRSLYNLQASNKTINDELKKIIQEKDVLQKINLAIKIYEEKENNKKKNINDLITNEIDEDGWWKEIQKKSINQSKKGKENGNNKIGKKDLNTSTKPPKK